MRLTNELRKNLCESVLKDQFKSDIDAIQKEWNQVVADEAHNDEAELSHKIMKMIEGTSLTVNVATQIKVINDGSIVQNIRVSAPFHKKTYGETIFNTSTVDAKKSFLRRYDSSITLDATPKIQEVLAKMKKIKIEYMALLDDLVKVLSSVQTVEKLQEVTKVFDSFIPKKSTGTQLIDAEALCRINALKIPKK